MGNTFSILGKPSICMGRNGNMDFDRGNPSDEFRVFVREIRGLQNQSCLLPEAPSKDFRQELPRNKIPPMPLAILEQSMLKVLAYYDVFRHPLTAVEIHQFLDLPCTALELEEVLDRMVEQGLIHQFGSHYSLGNPESMVARRDAGTKLARPLLVKARRMGAFLSRFPFVRGILVSGSLSKGVAAAGDDIDFFIITEKNRLWIARTLLHLFKKLCYLAGKQHWCCMNYFVDGLGLEIAEKNLFTATEIVTLLPLFGSRNIQDFFMANTWVSAYFPNHPGQVDAPPVPSPVYKAFAEWLLVHPSLDKLEKKLMLWTDRRWRKKEKAHETSSHGIRMGLVNQAHCSKPNPEYFQEQLLCRVYQNWTSFIQRQGSNARQPDLGSRLPDPAFIFSESL
jgi:hypothetical protein